MSLSTKQLGILLLLLCAITLTLAWIIERRQILSFRQELDAWGRTPPPSTPGAGAAAVPVESLAESTPDEPLPFVPPPAEPTQEGME